MSSRSDSRATALRDAQTVQHDKKPKPVSPKINFKRTITINNCIFEMKKGETEMQARLRINGTYKDTIL